MTKPVRIAVGALLIYLVLCFVLPKLLSVNGSNYWILAGGLAVIGLIASE